jgi:glycosyltransferase involved in cell wall biosynthesis
MTKILFPIYPLSNCGFPPARVPGGLFESMQHQIKAMLHAGFEVTLLTSKNFPVFDPKIKQIACNFLSKEEIGIMKWKEFSEAIAIHGADYDVVWLNSPEVKIDDLSIREKFKFFVSKLVVIYHHYDDHAYSSYFVQQYQTMAWVLENGGRVATVSKMFSESSKARFERYPDLITKNPFHNSDLPTEFVDKFEWIDILNIDEEKVAGELQSNGNFVAIGRPVAEKNLHVAIDAFLRSEIDGKLHVFTYDPSKVKISKTSDYYEKIQKIQSEKIIWHLGASRDEIYSVLKESSVLIFPSKKESLGLVPLEAISCGMRVIYGEKHTYYMEGEGYWVDKPSVKGYTEAVKNVGLPTVEEKIERREKYVTKYSTERFAERIDKFISMPR